MVSFIINCIMCVFHVLCIEGSFFTRILALPVLFFQKLVLYLYEG
jgi:hypothetical protein